MFTIFISADWSKDPRKRSVFVAYLEERRIGREPPGPSGWNLETLLALARKLSKRGSVLIGVDLALGVSRGYWRLLLDRSGDMRPETFVHWLEDLDPAGEFFETTRDPTRWRVGRPWFAIQPGQGGRRSFEDYADDRFLRRIDAATGAKPLFAVSGMPGTVGSGTRAFWQELIPRLAGERDFAIWPFECEVSPLRASHRIVLAESYPGLAYAAALAECLPARPVRIWKTNEVERNLACDLLAQAKWVTDSHVCLGGLGAARVSDDDFDAHITAAGLLRCSIDDIPLANRDWIDPRVEGSMLLAGPVDPGSKGRRLVPGVKGSFRSVVKSVPRDGTRSPRTTPSQPYRKEYRCPIPCCQKVFFGTRSGWDAHVGSPRTHPHWHPEVTDPEERKRRFKRRFREWLD